MIPEYEILFRLALAAVLGGFVGYERQSRRKSAGLRTNLIVAMGACLMMILSLAMYWSMEDKSNGDPARIAAQVVSGMGFLGAGAIMKEGLTVTGLTTAACLWIVAGIGLAVGAGLYIEALFTTVFVFVALNFLTHIDDFFDHKKKMSLEICLVNQPSELKRIHRQMEQHNLKIGRFSVQESGDGSDSSSYYLVLKMDLLFDSENAVASIIDYLNSLDTVLWVEKRS
ncbi:MgtC/SapB family protein [Selenomonas caprae]|uniref:MgtC/SapB family protein n=1 Tax=Selenomonas caprae TaxID=2606905 RepID=A0A5D6WQP9_9FIRM|nr:MgtC/SapB family protein [Selenomonas caprae]TYZ29642.1 MgtC/SapB family protein [Selenomonas caprae]